MINYEKENNGFTTILECIEELYNKKQNKTAIFKFVYDDKIIETKYVTMFESDNGEELESTEYEEFNVVLFENIETHEYIDIDYKTLPKELYCDGKRIL